MFKWISMSLFIIECGCRYCPFMVYLELQVGRTSKLTRGRTLACRRIIVLHIKWLGTQYIPGHSSTEMWNLSGFTKLLVYSVWYTKIINRRILFVQIQSIYDVTKVEAKFTNLTGAKCLTLCLDRPCHDIFRGLPYSVYAVSVCLYIYESVIIGTWWYVHVGTCCMNLVSTRKPLPWWRSRLECSPRMPKIACSNTSRDKPKSWKQVLTVHC